MTSHGPCGALAEQVLDNLQNFLIPITATKVELSNQHRNTEFSYLQRSQGSYGLKKKKKKVKNDKPNFCLFRKS